MGRDKRKTIGGKYNNYFIKQGYIAQSNNNTSILNENQKYWFGRRVTYNYYFQYHVYKYAKNLILKKKLTNAIDVGCGMSEKLMSLIYPVCKNIAGIDQEHSVNLCKKQYRKSFFYVDDFEKPVLKLGKFDLIICADVIEHLNDPDILLNYLKKFATKKSYILISTPERDSHRGLDCNKSVKKEHVREWNFKEFAKYINNSGFQILEHRKIPFMKFPLINPYASLLFFQILFRTRKRNTAQLILCKLK